MQQIHVLRSFSEIGVALVQEGVLFSQRAPKSRNGIKLRAIGQGAEPDDMAQLVTVLQRKPHATQGLALCAIGIDGRSLCILSLLIRTITARSQCFCYHHKRLGRNTFGAKKERELVDMSYEPSGRYSVGVCDVQYLDDSYSATNCIAADKVYSSVRLYISRAFGI